MSIFATIQQQLVAALKAKDEPMVLGLRTLKSVIQKAAIDQKKSTDDDALAVALLKQEAKKRLDAISSYRQGKREDLAKKEEAELTVIKQFLPEQLNDEAVRTTLQQLLQETDNRNFGELMKQAMQRLQNKADGKQVSTILKELLVTV